MSDRITQADLRYALAHHVDALERYGITYDGRLVLDEGSKTYGRAYRLNRIATGESGHRAPPIGSDYLGMTAREAYETLTTRTRAVHDVAAALDLPRYETSCDRSNAELERRIAEREQ